MPEAPDLAAAVAELDDTYLQVQLLLAVRRAASEEPRRASLWHGLAALFAAEQERRRRTADLATGGQGPSVEELSAAVEAAREELRRDAESLEAEFLDAVGPLHRDVASASAPAGGDPAAAAGGPAQASGQAEAPAEGGAPGPRGASGGPPA